MFEKALEAKFKAIFGVKSVNYWQPGDAKEQETMFIQVDSPNVKISDARAHARVEGQATMFATAEKSPFGFFAKAIAEHLDQSKDLFFYDIEENTKLYENIVQRSFSFVFFFDSQYDPDIGSITSITTEVTTT